MIKLGLAIFCALATAKASLEGYPRDYPSTQLNYDQNYGYHDSSSDDRLIGDEIPGVAGRDYPTFREVPQTRFECGQQRYPGYYADAETSCQAFHICQLSGRKDSFLCPNGTLFDQEKLVCEWWNKVDCSRAESFYYVNEAIARAMEEADKLAAERRKSNEWKPYGPSNNQINNFYSNGNAQKPSNAYLEPVNRQPQNSYYGNEQRAPINPSTVRPVYGVPQLYDTPPSNNGRYDQSTNYKISGTSFGKQGPRNDPSNIYLPA